MVERVDYFSDEEFWQGDWVMRYIYVLKDIKYFAKKTYYYVKKY